MSETSRDLTRWCGKCESYMCCLAAARETHDLTQRAEDVNSRLVTLCRRGDTSSEGEDVILGACTLIRDLSAALVQSEQATQAWNDASKAQFLRANAAEAKFVQAEQEKASSREVFRELHELWQNEEQEAILAMQRAEAAEDRIVALEAVIRQVEQGIRQNMEWVRRTKGDPGWKALTQWQLDLERQADALRAILPEQTGEKK